MEKIDPKCPRCGKLISEHKYTDEGSSFFPDLSFVITHLETRPIKTDPISKALSSHPFAQKYMPSNVVDRMKGDASELIEVHDCKISELEVYQATFGHLIKN